MAWLHGVTSFWCNDVQRNIGNGSKYVKILADGKHHKTSKLWSFFLQSSPDLQGTRGIILHQSFLEIETILSHVQLPNQVWLTTIYEYMMIQNNQRKFGSNISGLRMIFTWWKVVCAFTLHNNTSQKNRPWWRVVCDFTLHNKTSQKNRPWWRVVCDFTLHNNTSSCKKTL